MSSPELINHLKLCERYSFVWCRAIESNEVAIALAIQSFHFAEEHSEHRERIQLLVDLLELLSDNYHVMLHTEEAIADN